MADVEKPTEVVSASKDSAVIMETNAVEQPTDLKEIPTEAKETVTDVKETATDAKETVTDVKETSSENAPEGRPSKLEADIIRQLEYYFGDANLNRDKFLLEQISKDEGWVPLSVLLTFKRLSSLSTDHEVIVNALMKSDEGLIEISEDKQKLRRHPERPIPEHNEERRNEIMSRTAYAKGFPLDIDMSELIDFFNPYVKVVNINMRKYLDKATKTYKFKGSVFVTFEKKEQTQEFIEKEKVVFKERELVRKWQKVYLEEKRDDMRSKSKKKAKAAVEEEKLKLPKGTVLHFLGGGETVTREILREAVDAIEGDFEVAYVEYSKGEKEGHIRFVQENTAAQFLEKLEDKKLKLSIDDIELTLRTLSEEEEKAFLAKAVEQMKNRRSNQNKHKSSHHHHGNRKRRGGNDNRNGEKKKKATDDE